ncbi:hypothetical protein NFI96_032621 [Prochilodus magdalenae]|nr:hypothetical protein NFI96_032621 [Prochilodus magdalenae]
MMPAQPDTSMSDTTFTHSRLGNECHDPANIYTHGPSDAQRRERNKASGDEVTAVVRKGVHTDLEDMLWSHAHSSDTFSLLHLHVLYKLASNIANLTRSCRFLLYNIWRIRPFLSQEATQLLVQSLVISRLDYCNLLLAGLPLRAIRPLQLVQNAAARLIFNLPKFTHVTPLLRSLHWLPVVARIRFKTLMLAYKVKNGPAPPYLMAMVKSRAVPRALRASSTARLEPPSLRTHGR